MHAVATVHVNIICNKKQEGPLLQKITVNNYIQETTFKANYT